MTHSLFSKFWYSIYASHPSAATMCRGYSGWTSWMVVPEFKKKPIWYFTLPHGCL